MREQYEGISVLDSDPFKHYLYSLVMGGMTDSDEFRGDYDQGTFDMIGKHVIEVTPSGFVYHHRMKGHRWAGNLDMWLEDKLGPKAAFRVCEMMGSDWQEQYFVMRDDEKVEAALSRLGEGFEDYHLMTQWTAKGWNFYCAEDGSLLLEGV